MERQDAMTAVESAKGSMDSWAGSNGFTVDKHRVTYGTDDTLTMSFTVTKVGGVSKEASAYLMMAKTEDRGPEEIDVIQNGKRSKMTLSAPENPLKEEWLGRTVIYKGIRIKLVGFKSRARKRPFVFEKNGDPGWTTSREHIVNAYTKGTEV